MSLPGPGVGPFDLRPRRERTALEFDWVFPYAPWPAGRPLPTLRCWLDLPGAGQCEVALAVDTAADLTLVDGAFAAARGFDPTVGVTRLAPVRGVGGGGVAHIHQVAITIGPASDGTRLPAPPLKVLRRLQEHADYDLDRHVERPLVDDALKNAAGWTCWVPSEPVVHRISR